MNVTYGALIRRAAQEVALAAGAASAATDRLSAAPAGELAAHREMVHSLDLHFRQLLNPRAQPTGRTPPYPVGFDGLVSALCEQLHDLAGPAEARSVAKRSSHWHAAAAAIGAAGDLLATHAKVGGGGRTPEADDLLASVAARRAAISELADVASVVLSVQLRVETGRAGSHRGPDPLVAQVLAQECSRRDEAPAVPTLDGLGLGRPPIDTSHPLLELGDRLIHLRLRAWCGARAARPAIDDLKVFAALGQAVALHASAVLDGDSPLGAWREVSAILRPWRSSVPANVGVVGHSRRVMELLADVAPCGPAGAAPSVGRDVGQALRGAAHITTAIAGLNAATLTRLPGTRPTARARGLSGDVVTDDPVLVEAKLANHSVEMPDAVYEGLREMYFLASSGATHTTELVAEPRDLGAQVSVPLHL